MNRYSGTKVLDKIGLTSVALFFGKK